MHCTPPDPGPKPERRMDFNDPFGRVKYRDNSDYTAVRDSLRQAGVESREQAERCLRRLLRNGLLLTGFLLAVLLVIFLLAPDFIGIASVFAAPALLWAVVTTFNSRRLVRRFMAEEFGDGGG